MGCQGCSEVTLNLRPKNYCAGQLTGWGQAFLVKEQEKQPREMV